MGKRVIGILAHVDAGKTTLTESLLYLSGAIRSQGRVDRGDTVLDYNEMERDRGITIFSKQTKLSWKEEEIMVLDTPGHADFSPETERTLDVLDAAVLIISGPDGVQAQTRIWNRLLARKQIPTVVFINKTDRMDKQPEELMQELGELGDGFLDFSHPSDDLAEKIALLDEGLLENYLESGELPDDARQGLFMSRKLLPCYFGSARTNEGVRELLDVLAALPQTPSTESFGAMVYKIGRDEQGERLTYVKITGGTLHVKDSIQVRADQSEKVNQIRVYTSDKYETVKEIDAGSLCALTGLIHTAPGQGLGIQENAASAYLEPIMRYELLPKDGTDPNAFRSAVMQMAEEEPTLLPKEERSGYISVHIMGEIQQQILRKQFSDRFDMEISFGETHVNYKETIADTVEGVGHFEPLRHYAEVHLLLEPAARGEGIVIVSDLSEDILSANWQKQVLSVLKSSLLTGVLTGSPLTDMKITLVNGKAHVKHTEGGDFREATLRALRHGLMQAQSKLLEPWVELRAQFPSGYAGRFMTDMQEKGGQMQAPMIEHDKAFATAVLPASNLGDYEMQMRGYTGGNASISLSFAGYREADMANATRELKAYDALSDLTHPAGSVFCIHGAGTYVEWDEVEQYMHLPYLKDKSTVEMKPLQAPVRQIRTASPEELDRIFASTHQSANKRDKSRGRDRLASQEKRVYSESVKTEVSDKHKAKVKQKEKLPRILLVDGYNIIFAWEELADLAKENMDAARLALQDVLCNYQGITGQEIIIVYDAYRVADHETEVLKYRNVHIVFTMTAETADQYIEKAAIALKGKKETIVATSDGIEQVIVLAQGATILTAKRLKEEVDAMNRWIRENHLETQENTPNYLFDHMDAKLRASFESYRIGDSVDESGDKIGKYHE